MTVTATSPSTTPETEAAPTHPSRPTVSVIMPTYNYGRYVGGAIESVLAQSHRPIEIVVADDGSTDDTAERVASFGSEPAEGVSLTYLKLEKSGVGKARNTAIDASTGPLLAFLDADDLWLPGKLDAQLDAMEREPDAGFCHTAYTYFNDEQGDFDEYVIDPPDRFAGRCFDAMIDECGVLTSSLLMRRELLCDGGFPVDMPIAEDHYVFLMLSFATSGIYLSDKWVRYRKHAQQAMHRRRKRSKVYSGIARLRAVEQLRSQLPGERATALHASALSGLYDDTYDRYWRADYEWASVGFKALRRHGRDVPFRHRLKSAVCARLCPEPDDDDT